jgi:oligopeptide/dipeptide ABC transporter ATP-binding protein
MKGRWLAGSMNKVILEVKNLKVRFKVKTKFKLFPNEEERYKIAVDNVTFKVNEGETFGLVGETGSGKSTIARVLVGIYRPFGGEIYLMGRKIDMGRKDDILFLRRNIGIVFQDPVGSLNPKITVREIIREGFSIDERYDKKEQERLILDIINKVGIGESKLDSYPSELSGGEKQRVSLARALVTRKKILILDEPTSSLDVSIQAQILNLLRKLKEDFNLTYIFITHDLNVIRYMCDRMGVLYYGQLLELGRIKEIFENPLHPYTEDLISANLTLESSLNVLSQYDLGEPSRNGCIYRSACRKRFQECEKLPPEIDMDGRMVKCWLYSNATENRNMLVSETLQDPPSGS